jgi:hypothetical protein
MRLLPHSAIGDASSAKIDRAILEQHVSEGVIVARSALRLAVKNSVILSTLRDARPWNTDEVTRMAREAVNALMVELRATADRLEADLSTIHGHGRAAKRRNARQEASRLTLRAQTARGVVTFLRQLRDDDDAIARLVQTARDDTLMELTKARLQSEHEFAHQSPAERRLAMEGVAADLLELERQRGLRPDDDEQLREERLPEA